ncbi:MAG: twin-arginine translocation signal domain-containing protein [Phycisphaerae bacterium]|nr:twin-arginine translocation signal domain-containing protein [Phycisphaerae bacterium]
MRMTRRAFVKAACITGAAVTPGCGLLEGMLGPPVNQSNGVIAFKRSGRGLRISNAAKLNNANKVYATAEAAADDPAHPGDNSKVVQITMNRQLFDRLFANGKTSSDLRHDL